MQMAIDAHTQFKKSMKESSQNIKSDEIEYLDNDLYDMANVELNDEDYSDFAEDYEHDELDDSEIYDETELNLKYDEKTDIKEELIESTSDKQENIKPTRCRKCDIDFLNAAEYKQHWVAVHTLPTKVLECDECGKKLLSQESFDIHMKVHRGIPALA